MSSKTAEDFNSRLSESEDEQKGLRELLKDKILSNDAQNKNASEFNLAHFWFERNFVPGDGGQKLCRFIKDTFNADDDSETVKWQDQIDGPAEDLKKFEQALVSMLGKKKYAHLNRGYLLAIADIAKNQLSNELHRRITHLKGQIKVLEQIGESEDSFNIRKDKTLTPRGKRKKRMGRKKKTKKDEKNQLQVKVNAPKKQLDKFNTELALKEGLFANLDNWMTDIRLKLSGFIEDVVSEEDSSSHVESEKKSKVEERSKESHHTEESHHSEEVAPKYSKANFEDAQKILFALGQGNEAAINALKDAHYEDDDQDLFDNAFGRFMGEADKDLENSYLFVDGNEDIQQATMELLDYLLKLQKTEDADKKLPVFQQKSAENKIDGLVRLVQDITTAETLDDISNALKGALKGRGEATLQWNRGPFGKYWVGSMFKGMRNPIDKRFVNSTTEHKVVQLYDIVFNKQVEHAQAYEKSSDAVSIDL